jgi:hypothetical protein
VCGSMESGLRFERPIPPASHSEIDANLLSG